MVAYSLFSLPFCDGDFIDDAEPLFSDPGTSWDCSVATELKSELSSCLEGEQLAPVAGDFVTAPVITGPEVGPDGALTVVLIDRGVPMGTFGSFG